MQMVKQVPTRLFVVLGIVLALIFGNMALSTSKPIFNATETIVVPNVQTGEPMQLEVEAQPVASAEAVDMIYLNCAQRYTGYFQAWNAYGGWQTVGCGRYYGNKALSNQIQYVRDNAGPICVYYGSTLAGCAGKGQNAWVGNRHDYTATVRTQPTWT